MWYGNVNQQTAVWVANREIPVHDIHSSELKISNGNLVLFNESQMPTWSTNISSISSNSVVAVLEDGGNLVLKDGPKSSTPLWQSLDHPTHTWLPGCFEPKSESDWSLSDFSKGCKRKTQIQCEDPTLANKWLLSLDERCLGSETTYRRLQQWTDYIYQINQGEKQFRTEVSTIETIQHVNLVRLRGFCSDGARKLSVYDYMPKGSLDAHLFHESNSDALDWKTRYQIALGTTRGLVYLHEKCINCIIHCDIKPENILLDAEFCLKVVDFGLAKLVERDFSRVLTTMTGMMGYLVQEWISGVAITAKADVYSYGMILFEIVSKRRNS
ncbi:hypothetical protein GOBAR_AA13271 [Gossypium barbadense]|uniref:Protein kinase domain-containing protein n=1 Tax=Gossypium barbadense TaxID=3634 RepID=A0A2P5XVN5_GOSBA|nr:hypothetical protein GOBAR_AA13271 [Gossypium barbadense]